MQVCRILGSSCLALLLIGCAPPQPPSVRESSWRTAPIAVTLAYEPALLGSWEGRVPLTAGPLGPVIDSWSVTATIKPRTAWTLGDDPHARDHWIEFVHSLGTPREVPAYTVELTVRDEKGMHHAITLNAALLEAGARRFICYAEPQDESALRVLGTRAHLSRLARIEVSDGEVRTWWPEWITFTQDVAPLEESTRSLPHWISLSPWPVTNDYGTFLQMCIRATEYDTREPVTWTRARP